jgi:hypothetical protein
MSLLKIHDIGNSSSHFVLREVDETRELLFVLMQYVNNCQK